MAHKYRFNKKRKIGNQYYYFHADTEDELETKIEAKKAEVNAGIAEKTRDKTVKEYAELWVSTKDPTLGATYIEDIERVIKNRIVPEIGSDLVREVTLSDLQTIMNSLAGKYSLSYIKKVRGIIKGIFRDACAEGQCDKDPALTVKLVKGKKNKRRALTNDERKYVLQVANYHRFGLFVLLMLYCGPRPGEVAALKWEDIDLDERMIHIETAVKADGVVGDTKTESGDRQIPIPERLYNRLLKEQKETGYVVTNTGGGRYNKDSIRRGWESFRRQMEIVSGTPIFRGALIPPLKFDSLVLYDLRHTYISDLEAAGVAINIARELAGHKQISTTAEIYTHPQVAPLYDAAEKLDKLYEKLD